MTATATPALRWSSVRDCPRKAVYEATGAPARERTDREERILFRGKRLGRDYADFLAAKYGEDALERERKVTWPLGIGHIDIYLRDTRTAIEVLSSAHASEEMIHSKLLQLVGYMEHDDSVDNGVLVILNPSDFTEDRAIVSTTSDGYAELVDEMHERLGRLLMWSDGGSIPDRVCRKPADARSHFCQHAEHCFSDWQEPELDLLTDEHANELTVRLYHAKQREREVKQTLGLVESERKEIEQRLEDIVDPGTVQVGTFKLTRTFVQRQPSFDWKKAELAGVFSPEPVSEWFKPGASYSTWRVDRIPGAELAAGVTDEECPF